MKPSITRLLVATSFVVVVTPIVSAETHALRNLLDQVDRFTDRSWIGMELQTVVEARRARRLRLVEDDVRKTTATTNAAAAKFYHRSISHEYREGSSRRLKKSKGKSDKSSGSTSSKGSKRSRRRSRGPESCCDFLATLSRLDLECFNVVRQAEIAFISEEEPLDCAEDLSSRRTNDILSDLADDYEDAADDYDAYIDAALDGDFDNVRTSCFSTTPSTFTFACEPDAAIVTDDEASFVGLGEVNFDDLYLQDGGALDDDVLLGPEPNPSNRTKPRE